MLRNVLRHQGGNFSAIDETGRRVFIVESISFIFEVIVDEEMNTVRYRPVNYKDVKVLTAIDNYLRGVRHNKAIIERLVIRYGWMDRRLSNLSFVNLTDFMKNIRQGDGTSTDQRKLQELCKQLSLSMKNVLK